MRLVEELERFISGDICMHYWNIRTDHEDFNKILNAIYDGGERRQCDIADIASIMKALHKAGFKIVRI